MSGAVADDAAERRSRRRGDDVELHREPGRQVLPAVCVLAGTVLLTTGGGLLRTVTALGGVALGGAGLAATLRPFRFVIDADGLTVRRRGLRRQLRWAELALVVLETGRRWARWVAAAGRARRRCSRVAARRPGRRSAGHRTARPGPRPGGPDEIAAALARHAGDRFRDDRGTPVRSAPDFSVSLRGYSADVVDYWWSTRPDGARVGRAGPAGGARRAGRGDGERPADRPARL